jgi:hypothetical protein
MSPELLAKIINSVGLVFDIIGACLVAWEVVDKFYGKQYEEAPLIANGVISAPNKTFDFNKWEHKKYKKMKVGLVFLFFGFLLQILSNWTCLIF